MNPTQTTIEIDGTSYTFRLPSAKDMIQIDIEALKLRGGITEGLGVAYTYSQNVAMLSRLCVVPEGVDFGELPSYVMDILGVKLADWLNSFPKPVGEKQDPVGTGSSQ